MAFKDDIRFRDGIVCPYCGSKGKGVYKRGQTKGGKQRFYCEHCGKTFTSATNTILAWSHNDSTIWKKYIECMMLNMSVRKSAKKCGISKNTSFAWRHKILDSLQTMANGVKMDGIIESDETSSISPTRAITRKASISPCRGKHIREEVTFTLVASPMSKFAFLRQ